MRLADAQGKPQSYPSCSLTATGAMHKLLQYAGSALRVLTWPALLVFAAPALALPPAVSPAAGSDAVLALHPGTEGELRLQFTREVPGQDAQAVTVGIAADYHYIADPSGRRLYDYRLHRIFSQRPGGGFINDSLYAEAWFRATELANRVRLRQALQAGKIPDAQAPPLQQPFWMESELGVATPELPRPELKHGDTATAARWLLDGEVVAAVRYDAEPAPESIRPGLRRLWATLVPLHPAIADELAASGRIPAELWVTVKPAGRDAQVTHWQLSVRHWEGAAHFPLPPHLEAAPAVRAGAFPQIFALLSKEVAERKVAPGQEAYAAHAHTAIDHGAGLEALLWLLEMNLAVGHPTGGCTADDTSAYCTLLARAGPLARNDPRTTLAFAKQSPDAAQRAQFDTLPNAYLLKLLWATRPSGSGVNRADTERGLLQALRANAVVNFCKDTGDFYAAAWQPFAAWQVWDLGRLMAGHMHNDLLQQVDSVEDQLYLGESALF